MIETKSQSSILCPRLSRVVDLAVCRQRDVISWCGNHRLSVYHQGVCPGAQTSEACAFRGLLGVTFLSEWLPGVRNMRFWNHDLCLPCDTRGVSKCGLGPEHLVVHGRGPGSRAVGPAGAGVPLGPTYTTSYLCFLSLSRVDNIKFPGIWEVIPRVCVHLLYFILF